MSNYVYVVRCEHCGRDRRITVVSVRLDERAADYMRRYQSLGEICCNESDFELVELKENKKYKSSKAGR